MHSFVDFNLQVPANAAWFYVLSVLAASQIAIESHHRVRRVRREQQQDPALTEPAPRS